MSFPPHLDYLKDTNITWFNPCWGYHGFWKRFKEFQEEMGLDFKTAWLDKRMKNNKELYATALLALSMRQDAPTNTGWWFTKVPDHDPPDGIIMTSLESNIGNIINVREVEVVEYFQGELLDTFKHKMEGKHYEQNTALVCLLSPNATQILNLKDLSEQVQQANFPLMYIFAVFPGFDISTLPQNPTVEDLLKITLVQLTPTYEIINFSPHVICKVWREGKEQPWLKLIGRGKNTDLQKITTVNTPKLFD